MDIRQNVVLAPYTTFGIGGSADYFIIVNSAEEIIKAIKYAKQNDLQFFILGAGANILVGDKGFRGVVIKNEAKKSKIISTENKDQTFRYLVAESGVTVEELIKQTSEVGLSGLEHFAGIPSTLGGALWQNLHFLSPDRSKTVFIGDAVQSATVLKADQISETSSMSEITVDKTYFKFDYDYSSLHETNDVVLTARLVLFPEDPRVIQERIVANLAWRAEKHPKNAAKTSAGSIFRKIEGYGAGRLIEQVGLKGKMIGGAKVSDEHANFILNERSASAKDVRDLIELVQVTIKKELGLNIQTEISFVGEF